MYEYFQKMKKMNWKTEKPKFNRECVLITASMMKDYWEYTLWEIKKIECDGQWYWGLCCADGDEWGPLEDLEADLYCTFRPLKINKRVFS